MAAGKDEPPKEPSFQDRRQAGLVQRREARYSVPLDGVGVSGELLSVNGGHWSVRLWDISRHGACLVLRGRLRATEGTFARLVLHDNLGLESLWFDMQVRWSDLDMGRTFLGVEFVNNVVLPKETFLEAYFVEDWTQDQSRLIESMKDLGTL